MKNGYFEKKLSPFDCFVNCFVRLALLLRGSRRLFSSKISCEEYLETACCKPVSVKTGKRKGCFISKGKCRNTEYYVFKSESNKSAKTAVMYIHGGAYVRRLTSHHICLVETLCAKSGADFVVPLYLTLPEHTCHESLEELINIYKNMAKKYERVILSGDSCGGAICINLLAYIKDEGLQKPKRVILFSPLLYHKIEGDPETEKIAKHDPMFGGTEGLALLSERWFNEFEGDDPHAEPLYTDFKMNVPVCIFTSGEDMLSVGCKRFFEKAKSSAAPVRLTLFEKTFHCFVLYPLGAARQCIKEAAELINEE